MRVFVWAIAAILPGGADARAEHLTGCNPAPPKGAETPGVTVEKIAWRKHPGAPLPSKVKNYRYLPTIGNQALASCGAYAPTYYYKTYQEAREHGWVRPDPVKDPQHVMSPGFTFPLTNAGKNDGANIAHVMEVICRYGCADWKTMPEIGDYITYPNEAAWRNAIPYRGDRVISIDLSTLAGLDALKEHLAGGDLAVIAVFLYHDTYDSYNGAGCAGVDSASGVIYDVGTSRWDFHAFTVIGYDDDKSYKVGTQTRKGAFLAVNSWGPGWGVYDADAGSAGFAWFAYDFIMTKRGTSAGPAWAMMDRIGYRPTDFAVLDMNIQRRTYLTMGIIPGSPINMLAPSVEAFPNGGGAEPFGGRIVVDVTDFAPLSPLCYTLSGFDASSYFDTTAGIKTGAVSGFKIEKPGGGPVALASSIEPAAIQAGIAARLHAGPLLPASCGLNDQTTQALRVAWGDWNRDGAPDLAAAGGAINSSMGLDVYRNVELASATLHRLNSPTPEPGFLLSRVAWGDYDNDGFADLAVAGVIASGLDYVPTLKIYRNLQMGKFADSGIALPGIEPAGLAWGDVNNDGRVDLGVAGKDSSGVAVARLYRNDGGGKFTSIAAGLPQIAGSLSFADLNHDGWLDLILGNRILKNDGKTGTFSAAATLSNGVDDAHACGDYNNDGLLDIVYGRLNYNAPDDQRILSVLYRNNGNFSFTSVPAGFRGVRAGSMAWADFNNDGLLDLVLSGYPGDDWTSKTTRLYRQMSGGSFKDIGADLAPVSLGSTAWADLDQDGGLDLLVSGHTLDKQGSGMFQGATRFYRSQMPRPDGLNRRNSPPTRPAGLMAEWDAVQQMLRLKWSNSNDTATPYKSLGYRVRVGSYPGYSDVVSPHGPLSITGPHPHAMLPSGPGRLLAGLKSGRYFWSVQAIDGGLALSPWSEEQTFTIGAKGLVTGDVNRDGKLDVCDVILAVLMAQGKKTPQPADADMDGNGKVESLDAWAIARKVAQLAGDDFMQVAEGSIGASGGTLGTTAQGMQLIVPPGSFAGPKTVALETIAHGIGPETVPLGWRVAGLPIATSKALKLRISDLRQDTSTAPWVMIEAPGYSSGLRGPGSGFIKRPATVLAGGWLEVSLDPTGPLSASEIAELGKAKPAAGQGKLNGPAEVNAIMDLYGYTLVIHLLHESQWRYDGGHVRITATLPYKSYLPALARDFEDAYDYYVNTLKFDVSRRDWAGSPLEVCIMPLGRGDSGEPVSAYTYSGYSYDGINMQFNQDLLAERNPTRTAAAHDFFHVIQVLQDSRNRVARALTDPNLWLNEATATFMELHFAIITPYLPDLLSAYRFMIFDGYAQAQGWSKARAQNYGYGAASFIYNLVRLNNNDPAIIKNIYQRMRDTGSSGLSALTYLAPGYPDRKWFTDTFENFVLEKALPALSISNSDLVAAIAGPARTATLTNLDRGGQFPAARLSDLSASLFCIGMGATSPVIQAGDKLGFQLSSADWNLHEFSVIAQDKPAGIRAITKLGVGSYDSARQTLRLVLSNAGQYIKSTRTWLMPIVMNVDDFIPYDRVLESRLSFGVFQDYPDRPITGHTHGLGHIYSGGTEIPWPAITQSGKFSAADVTDMDERYQHPTEPNEIPGLRLYQWSDPAPPVTFEYTATVTTPGIATVIGGTRYIVTYTGPMRYRVNKLRGFGPGGIHLELVNEGAWQANGKFNLTLDDGEELNLYDFFLGFKYHLKAIDTSNGATITEYDAERESSSFWTILFRQ